MFKKIELILASFKSKKEESGQVVGLNITSAVP